MGVVITMLVIVMMTVSNDGDNDLVVMTVTMTMIIIVIITKKNIIYKCGKNVCFCLKLKIKFTIPFLDFKNK